MKIAHTNIDCALSLSSHTQIHPCVHKINIGDRIQAGAQVKTESEKCAQAAALHAQSYCYLRSLSPCSGLSSTCASQ